ncbi:hypothetical protein C0081_15975 [Cohaesibacter celericrescens]|uniref:Uncharacterized protein n=1 Tax=Cohaesibacter celericrescens TaxID=2067669 RepID=A0A2N5XPC3_9HYPH|nr:hypothetical protein C0081_15975 [Cohaesibacter celericrescens]
MYLVLTSQTPSRKNPSVSREGLASIATYGFEMAFVVTTALKSKTTGQMTGAVFAGQITSTTTETTTKV